MKEVTITKTITLPTSEEIEAVAKNDCVFSIDGALLLSLYIEDSVDLSYIETAVFECMRSADEFYRKQIATDVVAKFCELNDIHFFLLEFLI